MAIVKKNSAKYKEEQEKLHKKPDSKFNMIKAIKEDSVYKTNVLKRDKTIRNFLERHFDVNMNWKKYIVPGQLIMFDYFKPKYKEELEYYDAMPCTIFFGVKKTDQGFRVLGFNMHYYPPTIRYALMDKIFSIYKGFYMKHWDTKMTVANPNFDYRYIIYQLQKAKLDLGIREYIPELMRNIRPLTTNVWSRVVFTEGRFFKKTRDAVLNYWKQKKIDPEYIKKISNAALRVQKKKSKKK